MTREMGMLSQNLIVVMNLLFTTNRDNLNSSSMSLRVLYRICSPGGSAQVSCIRVYFGVNT